MRTRDELVSCLCSSRSPLRGLWATGCAPTAHKVGQAERRRLERWVFGGGCCRHWSQLVVLISSSRASG